MTILITTLVTKIFLSTMSEIHLNKEVQRKPLNIYLKKKKSSGATRNRLEISSYKNLEQTQTTKQQNKKTDSDNSSEPLDTTDIDEKLSSAVEPKKEQPVEWTYPLSVTLMLSRIPDKTRRQCFDFLIRENFPASDEGQLFDFV